MTKNNSVYKKNRESSENYLETILRLSRANGAVRSIDIVAELNFSRPSVSVAMKNLREKGYITVDVDGLISLTQKGLKVASDMIERHNILTEWLMSLGVDIKTAAEDACRIEHVISGETFDAIRRGFLNRR